MIHDVHSEAQQKVIRDLAARSKPIVAEPSTIEPEFVYYWGFHEAEAWHLIMHSSRAAVERCFSNQLDARKCCRGFSIWRRELSHRIGEPELVRR